MTKQDTLTIGDKTYVVAKMPPAAQVVWPKVVEH